MHNFPGNVCFDGCGTLVGRNGKKNSQMVRRGWGLGVTVAAARSGRRWAVLPWQGAGVPISMFSAPGCRDLGRRAAGRWPWQGGGALPSAAGEHSVTACFTQLVHLQAWVSAKQMQTSCLSVLIYAFKSTQYTHKRAESPGLTYKCQTKICQD